MLTRLFHTMTNSSRLFQTIFIVLLLSHLYITEELGLSLLIHDDNRNRVVFIDYFQHQVQICCVIGSIQGAHSFRPYLHLALFLYGQIVCQNIGHNK